MNKEFNPAELLYLPLDIPAPPKYFFDRIINDIESQPGHPATVKRDVEYTHDHGFFDPYRMSEIIHLCDRDGNFTDVVKKYQDNTDMEDWFYELRKYFAPTRAAITVTFDGDTVPYHIDCSPNKFATLQHKVRYVVRSKKALTFGLSKNKEIQTPFPWVDKPFVFSGKWPHTLKNDTGEHVFIFTMGAPWEASLNDQKYVELLERSYIKYKEFYMSTRDLLLPEKYFEYYEDKYKI